MIGPAARQTRIDPRGSPREALRSTALLWTLVGAQAAQQLGPAAKIWMPSQRTALSLTVASMVAPFEIRRRLNVARVGEFQSAAGLLIKIPSAESFAPRCEFAKIYVSLTN